MLSHDELRFLRESINILKNDFERHPNKFLTEDDMRVHLCSLLLNRFGDLEETGDNDRSIPIHTEVRWYGRQGKLRYRSDIVIIDVSSLIVKKVSGLKMPTKGYGFNMPKAIIELKLRRPDGDSHKIFKSKVEKDCEKLNSIKYELIEGVDNYEIFCFVIAFDKKGVIDSVDCPDGIHLVYSSSFLTSDGN